MSEQPKSALTGGFLMVESGKDKHQVVLGFNTPEEMHQAHVELSALRGLPDVPLAWANREQLLMCARQPREHAQGTLLDGQPRNVAGSALRTEYCNTPLYPRPAVLPGSWMLVERGIWSESQVASATACISKLRAHTWARDEDLAMAAIDAAQLAAPAVTFGDLFPLLEEQKTSPTCCGDAEPVLGWVDPERDEFLSVKGRQQAESMGHGDSAGRFSVPVVNAAESERLRGLLAEALMAIEGGCHSATLPDRIRAQIEGVEVDAEYLEDELVAAPVEPGEALAAAGFAELDRRGFRVGASDLGIRDLVAVYRAMQAADVLPAKVDPDALRLAMENLAVRSCNGQGQPPMVLLADTCLRVHYSGMKWHHSQLVNDTWELLSVDEFDAALAEALAKA